MFWSGPQVAQPALQSMHALLTFAWFSLQQLSSVLQVVQESRAPKQFAQGNWHPLHCDPSSKNPAAQQSGFVCALQEAHVLSFLQALQAESVQAVQIVPLKYWPSGQQLFSVEVQEGQVWRLEQLTQGAWQSEQAPCTSNFPSPQQFSVVQGTQVVGPEQAAQGALQGRHAFVPSSLYSPSLQQSSPGKQLAQLPSSLQVAQGGGQETQLPLTKTRSAGQQVSLPPEQERQPVASQVAHVSSHV